MGKDYADVCNRCGAMVVKKCDSDSSDMVEVKELELLFLSDDYPPGKMSRPFLSRTGCIYCPDCLLEEVKDWVEELKELPPSGTTIVKAVFPKER